MKVTLKFPHDIEGSVQIGDEAKKTVNGEATFDVGVGEYKVRGLALGFRGVQKTVRVEQNGQIILLDVRAD